MRVFQFSIRQWSECLFLSATVRLFLVSKLNHATLRGRNLQEGISDQIYQQDVWVARTAVSSAAVAYRHCP
jgi:hypothetical protein